MRAQSKVAEAKKEWDDALKAKERDWQEETERQARGGGGAVCAFACVRMHAARAAADAAVCVCAR